jgi:hypothetical protein
MEPPQCARKWCFLRWSSTWGPPFLLVRPDRACRSNSPHAASDRLREDSASPCIVVFATSFAPYERNYREIEVKGEQR